MDEEKEERNNSESFEKQQYNKGKEKLKDKLKKQEKQKIIEFLVTNPEVLLAIVIAIAVAIIGLVFFGGALYVVEKWQDDNVNNSKQQAVEISYTGNTSTSITDDDGNIINKIVIQPNINKDGYEIAYNDDSENLENIKKKLEAETSRSASEFSDFELAVFGALMDNGANLDYYTAEQLHCFPAFIKAEACTQYLDLRSNGEKFKNGDYVPEQIDDLKENEVPGVILVQRTNTKDNNPVPLEYKQEEEFNKLVEESNNDATKYFTINQKGNIVIAKKDHVTVIVDGEYPDNLSDGEKQYPEDRDIITTDEIAYSQYITKYTMPFEFLVKLLVRTKEPDFCKEVADLVLGSKIVINIQEEETITETENINTYTIHNKDEKRVDYEVKAANQRIVTGTEFLKYAKDDEGNDCTNYAKGTKIVKINTTYISHSYAFEISEADTWIAHYKKTYTKQGANPDHEKSEPVETDIKGKYGNEIIKDGDTSDKDFRKFASETVSNYKPKIVVPTVNVITGSDNSGNYKMLQILNSGNSIKAIYGLTNGGTVYREIKDEEGNGTGQYNLPTIITVETNTVPATDKTKEIPSLYYVFRVNSNQTAYNLQTSINPLVECIGTKINIKSYEKIDTNIVTNVTTTKYPADPNPTTNTHIYATEDGKPGSGHGYSGFEKFLIAYDNNKNARDMMNSVDFWLFEAMEENENTIDLIDTIKYLLYMYDGTNYGVTELDLSIYEQYEFTTIGFRNYDGNTPLDAFLLAWEGTRKDANGNFVLHRPNDVTIGYGLYLEYNLDIFQKLGYFRGIDQSTWAGILYQNRKQRVINGSDIKFYDYSMENGSLKRGEQIPNEKIEEACQNSRDTVRQSVVNETANITLTDNQIDALTIVKYKWGNIGNFKDVYHYYAEGDKDKFLSSFYVSDVHPMQKEYRLDERQYAAWLIFDQGKYIDRSGNEIVVGNIGNPTSLRSSYRILVANRRRKNKLYKNK